MQATNWFQVECTPKEIAQFPQKTDSNTHSVNLRESISELFGIQGLNLYIIVHMGVSTNGGTPIAGWAGWFIEEIPLNLMIWGYPGF